MYSGKWATPKQHRDQCVLFSPTLGEAIPAGHPIRRLDSLLLEFDWSEWEAAYGGPRGRPPFHPRLVAGAILYGLTRRVRSTRDLEEATKVRLDFMWFLHGMTIDHTTFAGFRNRFETQLEGFFKQLAVMALTGNVEVELAVDGTRIRSSSSRAGALTAESIERKAEEIAGELAAALEKMKQQDLFDEQACESADAIEKQIERLKAKEEQLARALETARVRDQAKARKGDRRRADCARVPVTDPDSHVLQNKEGGYAPNYTPTVAVDTASGVIIAADVPAGSDEASVVDAAVAAAREASGQDPTRILFDSAFATGANLEQLADQGIETYAPGGTPKRKNPAVRPDPSEPVPAEQYDALPMQGKKKPVMTKKAFVYDAQQDCYWCPMGRRLPRHRRIKPKGSNSKARVTEYLCEDCTGCELASRCLSRNSRRRRVSRDDYEVHREALSERMETDEARTIYKRRAPVAEGTFSFIKHVMGIRHFLLRGQARVRTEWLWIASAYNLTRFLAAGPKGVDRVDQPPESVAQRPDKGPLAAIWSIRRNLVAPAAA